MAKGPRRHGRLDDDWTQESEHQRTSCAIGHLLRTSGSGKVIGRSDGFRGMGAVVREADTSTYPEGDAVRGG